MHEHFSDQTPMARRGISRRGVVRTAAWSVPAVSLVAAAPAYATTVCSQPTDTYTLPTYVGANWAVAYSSTNGVGVAGATQLQETGSADSPRVFTNIEPNGGNSTVTSTVTTNANFTFTAGNIYYFTIPYTLYSLGNALPLLASLKVGTTPVSPQPFVNTDGKHGPDATPNILSETALAVFAPSADTTAKIQLEFVVTNPAAAGTAKQLGDDIAVHRITVSSCPGVS